MHMRSDDRSTRGGNPKEHTDMTTIVFLDRAGNYIHVKTYDNLLIAARVFDRIESPRFQGPTDWFAANLWLDGRVLETTYRA
jgi:hypothetical protein